MRTAATYATPAATTPVPGATDRVCGVLRPAGPALLGERPLGQLGHVRLDAAHCGAGPCRHTELPAGRHVVHRQQVTGGVRHQRRARSEDTQTERRVTEAGGVRHQRRARSEDTHRQRDVSQRLAGSGTSGGPDLRTHTETERRVTEADGYRDNGREV